MRLVFRALVSAAVLAAAVPGVAAAQGADAEQLDPEARQRFQLATTLYGQGRFVEAAEEFERVYELTRNADVLHNVYVAYRDAGDKPRAAEALRGYLHEARDIPDRAVMEGRLATLEREIAEDEERERRLEEAAVEDDHGSDASVTESAPEPAPVTPPSEGPSVALPIVVLSAAAALAIGGGVLGLVAKGQYEDLEEECGIRLVCPASEQDEVDSLSTTALVADILLAAGAVAAVVGGTWLAVELATGDGEDGATARLSPWCGPDGCGASLGGRF